MSNYNSTLQSNNTDLQAILSAINELPEATNNNYIGVEPAEDDIPRVFFGSALPQTKDEAIMSFRYVSKTEDIKGFCKTKAQGNSSMSYPKKNQTVKLYKDAGCTEKLNVDFKGWGKQNKFCFKANWIDLTHSRNIVSARLWGDVVKSRANYDTIPELLRTSPNQGAVDGFPVKVYASGIYQGRYTINIPKDAWMANMDDELDEHCILCGENYVSGCFRAAANINESDWTDEVHDSVPSSIKTRWNETISFVMNSTDDEFIANIDNYFDVDSLIDYYIFGVLSCGFDAFGKNQLYMTYDGQKWYATMYDMDSTFGLWWNGSYFVDYNYPRSSFEDFNGDGRDGNLLYIRLESLFAQQIKNRYIELKNGALSIDNLLNYFEEFINIVPPHIVNEDYASTTAVGNFAAIPSKNTNNIQQIRNYIVARYPYVNNYINRLNVEPPSDNVLYALPEPTTFDGTNYIDTGIQLFAEDKPFTLLLDYTPSMETTDNNWCVVAHCIHEVSPYPGTVVQYKNAGGFNSYIGVDTNQSLKINTSSIKDQIPFSNIQNLRVAIKKDENGSIVVSRSYNHSGKIFNDFNYDIGYVQILETLLLGCYRDANGGLGRYAKGVLNDCKVYDCALSDDQITRYMLNGATVENVLDNVLMHYGNGYSSDGVLAASVNSTASEKFNVESGVYWLSSVSLCPKLHIWDENDVYVGLMQLPQGDAALSLSANYKYAVTCEHRFGSFAMIRIDNSTTMYKTVNLKLAELTWTANNSLNGVEAILPVEWGSVTPEMLMKHINNTNIVCSITEHPNYFAYNSNSNDIFASMVAYNGDLYMCIKAFGTSVDDAMAYFAANDTTLIINSDYDDQNTALYPLKDGYADLSFSWGSGKQVSIDVYGGNHVKVEKHITNSDYLLLNVYDVSKNQYAKTHLNFVVNEPIFTLKAGDKVLTKKVNTVIDSTCAGASNRMGSIFVSRNGTDTMDGLNLCTDRAIGLDFEHEITVASDFVVDSIGVYLDPKEDTLVYEFDLEIYVNGVRYV